MRKYGCALGQQCKKSTKIILSLGDTFFLRSRSFRVIEASTPEEDETVNKIDCYLSRKGYEKVLDKDARIVIPDVETELKELTEATVFDCLFTDAVSLL
jgi:hypothetical protein